MISALACVSLLWQAVPAVAEPIRLADVPLACASLTEPGPDDADTSAFRSYWDAAVAYLSAPEHLNRSLSVPTRMALCGVPNGEISAETVGLYAPGGGLTRCVVVVYPKGVDELTDETLSRATMTHEAFHCFIDALLGRDRANSVNLWLNEGAAAWVGEGAVGGTSQSAYWWQSYLTAPGDRLFERGYSGIGFFSHLGERGIDVWGRMDTLFRANSGATPTPAGISADQFAFSLAVADNPGVLDSWPAGLARDPSLGADWDTRGPGITSDLYATPYLPLGSELSVPDGANDLVRVSLTADVIRIIVSQPSEYAPGKLRAADGSAYALNSMDLCARDGGCMCPSGSPRGPTATALASIAPGDGLLAVSGHVATQAVPGSGTTIMLKPMALDDLCNERSTPEPVIPARPSAGGSVPSSGRAGDATCGPWFRTGWYVSFNFGEPGTDDFWMIQIIVEPSRYAGPGTYPEEIDASSYGARVDVTQGNGQGYGPMVTAPAGGDMGTVTIGEGGASGTAHALIEDPRGGQIVTDYAWSCATVE